MTNHPEAGVLESRADSVAFFVPRNPRRVLVLAHGYPWPDDSRSDGDLIAYARGIMLCWRNFAERHHAIIIVPAFGGRFFQGYRSMFGRHIDADEYVNILVDEVSKQYMTSSSPIFSLHGHSAGAQFAARYLVTHPNRLERVVLSAPSTYPVPNPTVPWPNGMGQVVRNDLDDPLEMIEDFRPNRSPLFIPRPEGWLEAASIVSVNVLVGSRDTEQRPASLGQPGSTRIDRAMAWVHSMRNLAEASGRTPTVQLMVADGLDHDEMTMTIPAQELFARGWTETC